MNTSCVWLAAAAACLQGCAAFGPRNLPQAGSCGLDAAERLSALHGRSLGAGRRELAAQAASPGRISAASLSAALEGAGFSVSVRSAELRELCGLASKGLPAIVMLSTPEGGSHYALASACDAAGRSVTLEDGPPGSAPAAMPLEEFLSAWEDADRFTLIARPGPAVAAASDPALLSRSAGDSDCVTTCLRSRVGFRTQECRTVCREDTPVRAQAPAPDSHADRPRGKLPAKGIAALLLFTLGMTLWIFL
ncbi:MAG: hypothetical protein HY924_05315 [Elusimicrobia bacterium]|nr:hypothetical protein [Elusimicrobiota bacterium]